MSDAKKVLMLFPEGSLDGDVVRCDRCRHWGRIDPEEANGHDVSFGKCEKAVEKLYGQWAYNEGQLERYVCTAPDFGCALFEVKP